MKLKIFEADNLLNQIALVLKDCKGIVAYKLSFNLRKLNDELVEFAKIKQELFKKYGEEVDGKLIINKESDNYVKFIDELKVYENEEIEVNLKLLTEEEIINSDLNGEQIYLLSLIEEG